MHPLTEFYPPPKIVEQIRCRSSGSTWFPGLVVTIGSFDVALAVEMAVESLVRHMVVHLFVLTMFL
jgi:hypothetical protein